MNSSFTLLSIIAHRCSNKCRKQTKKNQINKHNCSSKCTSTWWDKGQKKSNKQTRRNV